MNGFADRIQTAFNYYGLKIEPTVSKIELQKLIRCLTPMRSQFELIRIGDEYDGGYLLPDDLEGVDACYSPGVGSITGFEEELARRNIKSHLLDGTLKEMPQLDSLQTFEFKLLKSYSSRNSYTLKQWLDRNEEKSENLILQMDIEGDEYSVILSTENVTLRCFRILVIEFHSLDLLIGRNTFNYLSSCFRKILKDFEVVHIHPNNASKIYRFANFEIPSTMEFTFLRRDRSTFDHQSNQFPHLFDKPNIKNRAETPLPKCWYNEQKQHFE